MAKITKRVVMVVAFDNRCPIDSDISEQVRIGVSNGVYVATAVTTRQITLATMTHPLAGLNQIIIELSVPDSTVDADIIALLTTVVNNLDVPTSPYLVVNSVAIV